MATVVITPTAKQDLETLIRSHSLPGDTVGRFRRSVEGLEAFPRIGATLDGRWARFRFVVGPWRWMVVVYVYDEALDRVRDRHDPGRPIQSSGDSDSMSGLRWTAEHARGDRRVTDARAGAKMSPLPATQPSAGPPRMSTE